MKKKLQYDTPQMELLDCKVEKGFAGSIISSDPTQGTSSINPLDVEQNNLPQFS